MQMFCLRLSFMKANQRLQGIKRISDLSNSNLKCHVTVNAMFKVTAILILFNFSKIDSNPLGKKYNCIITLRVEA